MHFKLARVSGSVLLCATLDNMISRVNECVNIHTKAIKCFGYCHFTIYYSLSDEKHRASDGPL